MSGELNIKISPINKVAKSNFSPLLIFFVILFVAFIAHVFYLGYNYRTEDLNPGFIALIKAELKGELISKR